MRYKVIRFEELKVLSGSIGRNRTYEVDESLYKALDREIYADYGKIFLKSESIFTDVYLEVITEKKFRYDINGERVYLKALDNSCITFAYLRELHFDVEDKKKMVEFFQNLKKEELYDSYIQSVERLFEKIENNKERIINGYGSVKDSVNPDDYIGGVSFDAKKSRELRKKSKG